MVDLHVHSTCSDGTLSPKELVDYAMEKHLYAFALTDHDCVDGLDEAISYARITPGAPVVVPGVELSTEYLGKDVHILGLFIDYENEAFKAHLKKFLESRDIRNQKMCRLLREQAGIDITYEALLAEFPDAVITRAHYARYMLEHRYIKSIKEAFDRYVGDHCPYFVPREKLSPEEGIQIILNAGGVPILAHPILYHLSDANLDKLVATLKEAGLAGIEAIYSTYAPSEERTVRRLANKYDLLISGGSDFHGSNKPKLDLGTGYGRLYVENDIFYTLAAYSRKYRQNK